MALIFHLSSESKPLPELTAWVWDKALHAIEYGALGLLVYRALAGEGVRQGRAVLIAIVLASAYAASDEWHQSFVPLRSADVLDWVADTIGSTCGAAIVPCSVAGPKTCGSQPLIPADRARCADDDYVTQDLFK